MDYELYHDESKEGGFWHGMLLVPVDKKHKLMELLSQARENTNYSEPISIKRVKTQNRIYDCAFSLVQIGVASLRSRTKGQPYPIFLGKRYSGKKQYPPRFEGVTGAKFILFCERDNLERMSSHPDYGSKVETTFRMGLKGGLHLLGNPDEVIHIEKMHFDGHEHYARHLDRDRIVGRLVGLRSYCSISSSDDLIDDRAGNHKKNDCQEYDDCQLLQLTDLLIGCFRTVLGTATRPIHKELSYPVKSIVDRYQEGYARIQNSRWRNGFCMSQCYLVLITPEI
jgi:hypothetical protein